MNLILPLLVAIVFWSGQIPLASAASFTIASKGKAKAEIVVPSNAEDPVAFAAEELRRYVKLMSGAELPIVTTVSRTPSIILATGLNKGGEQTSEDPREMDHYRLSNARDGTLRIQGAS